MRVLVVFVVLVLLLGVLGDTLDIGFRCNYCNDGYCESQNMQIDACTSFCNPCDAGCDGYYKITENADSGDYALYKFTNSDCTAAIEVGIILECDSCYSSAYLCPTYYIRCSSVWWWVISIGILVALGVVVVLIAGFAYWKRQQNLHARAAGPVETVSYAQASYQSTGNQSAPPANPSYI